MNTYSTYLARINRVFDYIDAHLAEPLDIDTFASVAHFSTFHFHRVFKEFSGETLAARVRRRRVEPPHVRCSRRPAIRPHASRSKWDLRHRKCLRVRSTRTSA